MDLRILYPVERIAGVVQEVLSYEPTGVRVLLSDGKREWEALLPLRAVAEGDEVQGLFYARKGVYYPLRENSVQVREGKGDPFGREFAYAVLMAVPQIGQGRAQRLARMGRKAFDYLLGRKSLAELYTSAEHRAFKETKEALIEWRWYFEALEELTRLSLSPLEGALALAQLGLRALGLARKDPFLLCQVEGVSYEALSKRLGRESPVGKLFDSMKAHIEATGDTLVHRKRIPLSDGALAEALKAAGDELYVEGEWFTFRSLREEELELLYALEEDSPIRLPPPPDELTPEQKEAFLLPGSRIGVLTGGPGTGKTFTVSRLVRSALQAGIEVTLLAPTGKAARRMTELSGLPARTIHSALRVHPENPFASATALPRGLVVMDEASMADLKTMGLVLSALPPRSSLLLVGDANQLPPVSAGSPFADLVGRAPTVRLSVVQRQGKESGIVWGAYGLLEGRPLPKEGYPDLQYIYGEEEVLLRELPRLTKRFLSEGYRSEEVQVLTPTHEGPLGTRALNDLLQGIYRPNQAGPFLNLPMGRAYVGDKIVFNENRLAQGVANGTMGVVEEILPDRFILSTPEGVLEVPKGLSAFASLAYAITVHRSQGSEWPVVLLVLPRSGLVRRKLVYTGLTRAKAQAVILSTFPLHEASLPVEAERKTYLKLYFERRGR